MAETRNDDDQPIGLAVPGWSERALPPHTPLVGRTCSVEKLDADRHAADLFAAYAEAPDQRDWTYLSVGPFADAASYGAHVRREAVKTDPFHHAIVEGASGRPIGTAALMRIDPRNGVIEIGHIAYAPRLQRSRAGTEAIYLLLRRVFDELGYRRCEWKCDSLHATSRRAAERYGFRFEGIFRQAVVYKGRTRDTAWFSIIDGEWPAIRQAFERWLSPDNFDADGRQRRALATFRAQG